MKEYVNQYPNFSVFELKQNTGAAAVPRNVGLARANGKYLAFLDPDDWYLETAMETLVSRLDASGEDFGIGGIIEVTDSRLKKSFCGDFLSRSSELSNRKTAS
ncbi:glycosyltransferase [Weissella cibaria]|nr:glycosyltransferase [Weissella cibaria]